MPMPSTHAITVVNIHDSNLAEWRRVWVHAERVAKFPELVYIGRAYPRYRLPASPWANPFRIMDGWAGERVTREQVIGKFREWVTRRDAEAVALVARAKVELAGKVLVCHCKPLACHGDVLAEIVGWMGEVGGMGGI